MSFWSTSTGENLAAQTKEEALAYTPASNDLEPIPDGSKVRAFVKEAGWDKDESGNRYIKLRWDVIKPDAYARRVVFHRLWVLDDKPGAKNPDAKRDSDKRQLRKIDELAGGRLAAKGTMPNDDELLIALANKEMVILVKVWEMKGSDGQMMSGNWVRDVFPCEGTALVEGKPKPKAESAFRPHIDDEEIPF